MTKLQQALEQQKDSNEPVHNYISGILGIPLGGRRVVEVSNRNSFVYVRLRNNQSEVIQAFNNQVSPSYNLPVLVERQGNRYVVTSVDTQRYGDNWSSFAPFLPRHGNTHSFDLESGGGGDVVWVQSRQIAPLLAMPSGSDGGPNVIINPYTLKNADGSWKYIGNTGTQNLTTYNPAGSNAVMVLVYADSISGNPYILVGSGSYFANSITGTSAVAPYIPSVFNPAHIPLAAVRLVTGTSTIGWDNIYDVRQWLHTIPTGTAGGSSGADTIGIAGTDEGVPIGTGTVLNITGERLNLTRSGTVLNLNSSPDPQELIGFYAQDEGVPLGTGTVLNFVGGNVDASISGSVVRVFVTGSSGGTSLTVEDTGGGDVVTNVDRIIISGSNSAVADLGGGDALVIIGSPLTVEESGGSTTSGVTKLVFNDADVESLGGTEVQVTPSNPLPQGYAYNYKISPTTVSGSLVVSLKTLAGTDPSTTDKIYARIGNTQREITSALSTSLPTGTNRMGAGSAELAGKAVEYFVYLIQETGGSAGTKIGISRIPYARIMNDFVNTLTDEKYIAGNWTNFSADDEVENIGRIRATKASSVGGWTTFSDLSISRPIYHTNWVEWTPGATGFTANPTFISRYKLMDNLLHLGFAQDAAAVSNSTLYILSMPFKAKDVTNYFQYSALPHVLNNSGNEAAGLIWATPNSNVLTLRRSAAAAWTNSGNKNASFNIAIEI